MSLNLTIFQSVPLNFKYIKYSGKNVKIKRTILFDELSKFPLSYFHVNSKPQKVTTIKMVDIISYCGLRPFLLKVCYKQSKVHNSLYLFYSVQLSLNITVSIHVEMKGLRFTCNIIIYFLLQQQVCKRLHGCHSFVK